MKKFAIIIFVVTLISCKDNSKQEAIKDDLSKMVGEKININDLEIYCGDGQICEPVKFGDNGFMIITLINAECSTCIENINSWNEWDVNYNSGNGVLMIPYSSDRLESFTYLMSVEPTLQQTFYLDRNNKFKEVNGISEDQTYHTFLVDEEYKVILVGNPVLSEGISDLYLKVMRGEIKI